MKTITKTFIVLFLTLIFYSCATTGYYPDQEKITYNKNDYLGEVSVYKTYVKPLFIGPSPEAQRNYLSEMLTAKARKEYGENIKLEMVRYFSNWSPYSLLLGFSIYGWVEDAGAKAHVFKKTAEISKIKLMIEIGMPSKDLIALKGLPDYVNRSTSLSGVREQWVYSLKDLNGRILKTSYYYFENGILTSIQD